MDKQKIEAAVRLFLEGIGENPEREGLTETPGRVSRMCEEIFSGLYDDPASYLKSFSTDSNGAPVIIRDIPFYSVCEHHLLPFFGKVSVLYIPAGNKVIGLSKIARIVNCFAKKPQIQEQFTDQLASFLYENIESSAVAVYVEAEHLCMSMRGIKSAGAVTQTISVRGDISYPEASNLLK